MIYVIDFVSYVRYLSFFKERRVCYCISTHRSYSSYSYIYLTAIFNVLFNFWNLLWITSIKCLQNVYTHKWLRCTLLSRLSHSFKLKCTKNLYSVPCYTTECCFSNQPHRQNFTFIFSLRCFWCSRTEVASKWYQKILMPWDDASNTFILNRTAQPPEFWHWLDNVTSHWPLCVFGDTVACCDLLVLVTTSIGLVRG